jgi:phosphoglycolate phosphatase-like HAD superfamily hydrolase
MAQYSYCVKTGLQNVEYVEDLHELKQNGPSVPWGIVSNAPSDEIRWYLEQRGWIDLFEDGIYGAPRPKAEVFEEEYNTSDRQQILFLGDSQSDFEVAKEFDIEFAFVRQWSRDPYLADNDDVSTIESVGDLYRT